VADAPVVQTRRGWSITSLGPPHGGALWALRQGPVEVRFRVGLATPAGQGSRCLPPEPRRQAGLGDAEVGRAHPLTELLADLRQLESVGRLSLSALDEVAGADLLQQRAGLPSCQNSTAMPASHRQDHANFRFRSSASLRLALRPVRQAVKLIGIHRRPIAAVIATLLLLFAVMLGAIALPPRLLDTHEVRDADKRLTAVNELRTSLLGILGGFAVVVGSLTAYFNFRETQRNNSRLTTQNQDLFELQLRGQVTDRFTKATDQLGQGGAGQLPVRIAAIYALEQIARDSSELRRSIGEVLASFLRHAATLLNELPLGSPIPGDVRATIVVLGRRQTYVERTVLTLNTVRAGWVTAPGENLSGAEMCDCQIVEADFSASILQGANLRRLECQIASFTGADLRGVRMRDVRFRYADLAGAQMQGARLRRVELQGSTLNLVNLRSGVLDACRLRSGTLLRASLQGAKLDRVELQDAVARGADLQEVQWKHGDAGGADLEGVILADALVEDCSFDKARLLFANVQGAQLTDCSFEGADLSGADLRRCQLQRVSFRGASLDRADLRNADMQSVELVGASLDGTLLGETDTSQGDATGLEQGQLELAQCTDKTVVPSYLRRP
jgi:uncharacterized protein YjbI with pentapeptide repeats